MVVYVMKYNIRPDKMEAFTKWATGTAIPQILKLPGLVEFSSYRPVTGSHQIAALYRFKDMASVAGWLAHPDYQKMMAEFLPFVENLVGELWGPSPVVPEPLHPKK